MKWSKLYWVINFANGVWAKKKLWLGKSRIFYDMDETLHLKWHFMIYPYGGILWPICTLELNWVDHIIVCIFKKLFTSRSKYWGTNIFLFTRMWIFSSSKHRYLKTNFFLTSWDKTQNWAWYYTDFIILSRRTWQLSFLALAFFGLFWHYDVRKYSHKNVQKIEKYWVFCPFLKRSLGNYILR